MLSSPWMPHPPGLPPRECARKLSARENLVFYNMWQSIWGKDG